MVLLDGTLSELASIPRIIALGSWAFRRVGNALNASKHAMSLRQVERLLVGIGKTADCR
jgi:hypothetical protein